MRALFGNRYRWNKPILASLILGLSESIFDINLVRKQKLNRILGYFYVGDDQGRSERLARSRQWLADQGLLIEMPE